MRSYNSDKLKLIIALLIYGTIGVVRKNIPYPSSFIAFARAAIGFLFLLCFRLITHQKIDRTAVKRNFKTLLLSGTLLGFNWLLLFEAYNYTSVAVATVCYYMSPVFLTLASPLLGERLTVRKLGCVAVALLGMVLVSGVLETGLYGLKGIILGLVSAVTYAVIVMLNKTLKDISAGDRTIMQLGISSIVMLPYVLLTENVAALEFTFAPVMLLLVAGIIHTGFAYTLYFGGIAGIPAQTAAVLSYIDPITAILLSVVLLREDMSAVSAIGCVLVIRAMLVSDIEPKKKKIPAAEQ